MTIKRILLLGAALSFTLSATPPANAEYSWVGWHDASAIGVKTDEVERQMVAGFQGGALSPQQYADLERDISGLRCDEEMSRAQDWGIGPWAQRRLLHQMDRFKAIVESNMGANLGASVHPR